MSWGGRSAFLAFETRLDFGQRGIHGSFANRDEFVGAGEVVPHERLHVGLDDYVGLLAPRDFPMPLDNSEGTADDVRHRAWIFQTSCFKINRNDDIRAKQQSAFDGNGRG